MDTAVTIALPEELSESKWTALVKLLADEDPAIYHAVRSKILAYGPRAAEWLRPHRLSDDPALRRRANEIVLYFQRQAADTRFLAFCLKQGETLDLEQGAWLLAQTQYPEINIAAYQAILDGYTADLRTRLTLPARARPALSAINFYLFRHLGFHGNDDDYYDPQNSYLNRVIDRRTGNPIALCLLYIVLAHRLRLPIAGIGLPGHFICRYQSSAEEFYIDAFNRGRFLTKADCVQHLAQANYQAHEDYLAPVSPRRTLLRICNNLHQIYLHVGHDDEATRLRRYLVALGR